MDTMDRAYELAEEVKDNEVYSVLAEAQLEKGMVKEAIRSYIKAENHKNFSRVISASIEHQLYENLIHYLVMCRVHCKHPQIEGELMYAYAITENLSMLQELVSTPNVGQTQEIANRCYQKGLYKAAKLLFNSLSNYSRLCSCLIKLDDYESAVDAARKASNTQTWKEINLACIDTGKFSLAQICGIHLMQHGGREGEKGEREREERGGGGGKEEGRKGGRRTCCSCSQRVASFRSRLLAHRDHSVSDSPQKYFLLESTDQGDVNFQIYHFGEKENRSRHSPFLPQKRSSQRQQRIDKPEDTS